MRFDEKVAFITGGGMGFGRAFAWALGTEGASVVIADLDGEAGSTTAAALRDAGVAATSVVCDIASEAQVDAAVAHAVDAFGGIDILINNAGRHLSYYSQPFSVLPRSDVRALFEVNVIGTVNCTVACRAVMKARGGGVVLNISSSAGFEATTPYGVSKLAVRGLTVAFASELGADGIRVNGIAPGLMATEAALEHLDPALVSRWRDELQKIKRTGQMDDVVRAMLYLCSDESSFVTGETLRVTGGHPLGL